MRQPQRGLAAELDDHRLRILLLYDRQDIVDGERLEVEAGRCVVVGGDRLRVAVDHHRLVPGLLERHRGVNTAIVELDPLPDPVRARSEHDDGGVPAWHALVFFLPRAVEVGGDRLELGGTRVDGLEGRFEPPPGKLIPHRGL